MALKKQQRKILHFLQRLQISRWINVFGLYRGGGSHLEHARQHANSRFILKLDLKEAFPSITYQKLKPIIFDIAIETLSRQIDILNEDTIWEKDILKTQNIKWSNRLTRAILHLSTYEGKLPQGAPTSPFLFYMFIHKKMEHIYRGIQKELKKHRIREAKISWYVDNIVISSEEKLIPPDIIEGIARVFQSIGLSINSRKTKLQDCRNGAVMITGLMVDGKGNVSIPKKKREQIRAAIHNACFIPFSTELDARIEGLINYTKSIYDENLPRRISEPYKRYETHRNDQKSALTSLEPIVNQK